MKKYVIATCTCLIAAVSLVSCSSKGESTVAYQHMEEQSILTETEKPTGYEVSSEGSSENTNNENATSTIEETTEVVTGETRDEAEITSREEVADVSAVSTTATTALGTAKRPTAKPKATRKPRPTAAPQVTVIPEVTVVPTSEVQETVAPQRTMTPIVTVCPTTAPTVRPQVTVMPAPTVKPQATAKPTVRPQVTVTPKPTVKPQATAKPTATPAPTVKPQVTSTPGGSSSVGTDAYIAQVLTIVNEERAKEGLSPLTTNATLKQAANKRAQEIVSTFSHTRPDGTSGVTVLKEYGISYNAWGENIAYGQKNAAAVMNAWMNSSGHRANILSNKYGKVGIGCYEKNGVLYWTQVFTN